jgi:hypothetical protein
MMLLIWTVSGEANTCGDNRYLCDLGLQQMFNSRLPVSMIKFSKIQIVKKKKFSSQLKTFLDISVRWMDVAPN